LKIENSATNITNIIETITTTKSDSNNKAKIKQTASSNFVWLLDRKIEDATAGLRPEFSRDLHSISEENALTTTN
jgi:hypothetical protein